MAKKNTETEVIHPIVKRVRITLTEPMLGTKPGNPELLEDYIVSKRPDGPMDDELEAALPEVDEELRNTSTFFNRDPDGKPVIFDYQVKGFFKDAQGCLGRVEDKKMQAFKKIIDGLVFVYPRLIALNLPEGSEVGWCTRPLRVGGASGERTCLARSEEVPAGTWFDIHIKVYDPTLWAQVQLWLNYGADRGIGQWRNSGKGRFTWQLLD